MRWISFFTAAALLPTLAFSAPLKRAISSVDPIETGPVVQQLDSDFPIDQLAAPGLRVDHLSDPNPNGLPSVADQRRLLRQAGLESTLSWDPLDLDLFFGMVGELSPEQSIARFKGRASPEGIRKLHGLIKDYRRQERSRR